MRFMIARKISVITGAALVTLLTISLVFFPKDALRAAIDGMNVFWKIVFPSLLPFFVLSEILLGLGVVHFMGVLLEPLMRPVFNVPGVGAFALSMGLAAGYPMDAVITGKFRRKGLCTRSEGERLLAFTNTADPLFIFGSVAVGMFGQPRLGVILAVAHYLSSFSVGFIFRFYHHGERSSDGAAATGNGNMLYRAGRELLQARREDGRPFGQLMGEAVRESISTLLMICGFIMLFSVLVRILDVFGIIRLIAKPIGSLLAIVGLSPELVPSFCQGLLEIDLGTMAASQAAAPLVQCAVMSSAIIAWSGLSVHGQVASVIHGTDISMKPYIFARFCHAVLAGFYTFLLFKAAPVALLSGVVRAPVLVWSGMSFMSRFSLGVWQLVIGFGLLIVLAVVLNICRHYVLIWRGFGSRNNGY